MITRFKVQSFKSIESAEVELGRVNFFIGANGSGKSNLLEALSVLAAAAFGRVDQESLARRGCRPGGYFRPLFREIPPDIETILAAEGDHASYAVTLVAPAPDRPAGWEFRKEFWRSNGEVLADRGITNGSAKGDPQAGLAALRLAETPPDKPGAVFLKLLAAYSVYLPNTLMLRGWIPDAQIREPIGLSGGRLASAVRELMLDPQSGAKILAELTAAVAWFAAFGVGEFKQADKGVSGHALLFTDKFFRRDGQHDYWLSEGDVNEGILYLLFMGVLSLHRAAPSVLAIDNADHGLNPLLVKHAVQRMCDWILGSETPRQILITTHNPLALDGLPLQNDQVRLFTVDRDNQGRTRVRRFVITDTHRDMAEKGWTLSRLWVNGLIGGVPNV
jgi:energy-coupling factor transporter ATP-binding protein EcfA2